MKTSSIAQTLLFSTLLGSALACQGTQATPPPATPDAKVANARIYDFDVKSIDGHSTRLREYAGKVLLIVNVASKCGFTPQYEGFEKLYAAHEKDGLVVLGFPSDQFGHQEPGTESEIKTFCTFTYGVKFPMFAKVDVNGPHALPLFTYLRASVPAPFTKDTPGAEKLYAHIEKTSPEALGTDAIKWNFTKFLVDRQGNVVKRYESGVTPEAIDADLAPLLAQKP